MPYRIEYDCPRKISAHSDISAFRIFPMFSGFFLLFVLFVCRFWPEGRAVFAQLLFPGGAQPAMAAAEVFVEELRNGEPISEALEHFCRDILTDVYLP